MFNIQINSSIDINQIKSFVIKSYMGGFPPFNEEFSKEIAGEILKNSIISEKILTLKSISLNTVVTFQKEFGEIDQTFKVFL